MSRPIPTLQHRAIPGVLFEEDFDVEEIDPADTITADAAEPVYSGEELEAARLAAHAAGRVEGEAAMRADACTRVAAALEVIAAAMADADAIALRTAEAAADSLARLMLEMLLAALPALCARHGDAEVASMVRTLVGPMKEEPSLRIQVNPAQVGAVTAELARFDPDLAARVDVQPTPLLAEGDARLHWKDGHAVREAASIRAHLEAVLAPLGLLGEPLAMQPAMKEATDA